MITIVGTQTLFADALQELAELDLDAVEAYKVAIHGIENKEYKEKLTEFKKDHEKHVKAINKVLDAHKQELAKKHTSGKTLLTKGKVAIGALVGDTAILTAINSNEKDTVAAYEKMHKRKDIWPDADKIITDGLKDEKRHKAWLDKTLK